MAAAHLLCLTAEGGVPLFYKNTGDLKPLPFPVIGSLNGVHLFCKNHAVNLKSALTDSSKVMWREFHNSINLLIVTQDDCASDHHLDSFLDLTFQAMVLLYGLDDLTNIKNVDRFKREIRVCFKLLDTLLDPKSVVRCSIATSSVETVAGPETSILQNYVNAFAEAADSPYGCLMVGGRVVAATSRWWELTGAEMVLLSALLVSLPRASSRDVAVFLPDKSPTVPHRLLTFELLTGLEVCVICGPTPPLSDLHTEVERFWSPAVETLRTLQRSGGRSYAHSLVTDSNTLGFLLVNRESHRSLCSVQSPSQEVSARQTELSLDSEEQKNILISYYKSSLGSVWSTEDHTDKPQGSSYCEPCEKFSHSLTDTYVCCQTHKLYALSSGSHIFCVLYQPSMPTYAMRSVTQQTFQTLMKDKNVVM